VQNLLFLVHRVPCPPTKGDKVRSSNLLKYLATRYKVYLGAFLDDLADLEHVSTLRSLCEECHIVRLNPTIAAMRSLWGLVSGQPLTLPYYSSASMRQWVQKTLREQQIHCVLTFSAAMTQYVMSDASIHRVADLVDVDSDKWRQYAVTRRWPYSAIYRRECAALQRYECQIAREFETTVFVSMAEANLFRHLAPEVGNNVRYVNNGVDCDYFSPEHTYVDPYGDKERVLVFTGAMDYWPNVDAVVWFANNVFPKIYSKDPRTRFYIVGARPAAVVQSLSRFPGVKVTGTVPDIRPYIAHARLAVAPLRIARGIQNKVLEAMAMAKPDLASPQAAEGIEAKVGTELLIAVDEAEFVRQALHLLFQGGAAAIGAAGRARTLDSYSWERNLSHFDRLLKSDVPVALVDEAQSAQSAVSAP
jgi:sugar transferase (PEP-CTERM/EpsH1 system associated)